LTVARELRFSVPLGVASLADARAQARAFLACHELPAGIIEDVLVVLTEAIGNAARHSGADLAHVTIAVLPATVDLTVSDDGRGFDLDTLDLTSRPALLSIRGRGFYLMSCVADAIAVETRPGEGTTVRVHKQVQDLEGSATPLGEWC
jgi:signal transduction histidine kinase